MSDYNSINYEKQGGADWVVGSGGTLNIAAGGALQIAGVALTPSAAEINVLASAGVTAAEVAKLSAAGYAADGLDQMRVARFTFDAGIAGNQTIAAHGTGVTLPINAIVYGGFYDVNTGFTSAGGNAGTVAISLEAANDLLTATAVSNAILGTIGRKAIVPVSTAASTVKATAAREVTCTVAGQVLTAGKLTGFLLYVVSVVSA